MWLVCEDSSLVNADNVTAFTLDGKATVAKFVGGGYRIVASWDARKQIYDALHKGENTVCYREEVCN